MNQAQPVAPLTIVAIFAGIIEASALATLPFLSEASQTLYTWFLVGFPFFLTALFFLTLNFNYKSFYTPAGSRTEAVDSAQSARKITSTTTPSAIAHGGADDLHVQWARGKSVDGKGVIASARTSA